MPSESVVRNRLAPGWTRLSSALLLFILLVSALAALAVVPAAAQTASCTSAGSTGLTTAVSASNGQYITGTVDASGCDVGVYVGPGVTGVAIANATITGANDHGIFVQDASRITIYGNIVEGNGVSPHLCPAASAKSTGPCITEDKAIELAGTSYSAVADNLVKDNHADGGIGITDDGAVDPGAPSAGTSNPGQWNTVVKNTVVNNTGGCGIVVASYDSAGVMYNQVLENMVVGTWLGGGPLRGPPFVGGVVVAADTPQSMAKDNYVFGNTVVGSVIPGVVVHSNAPGDVVSGTVVWANNISRNGLEGPPNDPALSTGIEVVAEVSQGEPTPPMLTNTAVLSNTINGDVYALWTCNDAGTLVGGTSGNVGSFRATCQSG